MILDDVNTGQKNWFLRILCAYLIIIPCFFVHGADLRMSQETAFQLGTMILVFVAFMNPIKNSIKFCGNFWVSIFGIWCVVNYTYFKFIIGPTILINLFLGIVLYYVCCMYIKKKDIPFILKTILFVCAINLAYILVQDFLKFDPLYSVRGPNNTILKDTTEPIGFFGFKACCGMYFAIAMPLLAYLFPLLPALSFYPLYIALCSSATVGGPLGLLFYFWKVKSVFFWLFLIICIGGSVFLIKKDFKMQLQGTRISMWKQTIKVGLKRPITGWGLDSFRSVWTDGERTKNFLFLRINNDELKEKNVVVSKDMVETAQVPDGKRNLWDNPHNELIMVLFEMGITGLCFIGMFFVWLFKRYKAAIKSKELIAVTGALIAFFCCSMTQFPLHLARLGHLFPILLALFVVCSNNEDFSNENKLYN